MNFDDGEIKLVAGTAVAASIAIATAEHIAKESTTKTLGVKVAQMAAQVADAVAKGMLLQPFSPILRTFANFI